MYNYPTHRTLFFEIPAKSAKNLFFFVVFTNTSKLPLFHKNNRDFRGFSNITKWHLTGKNKEFIVAEQQQKSEKQQRKIRNFSI